MREKIVNVFLIEEQKIVKKVPEALGKNKEAKWDFSTLNKEIYLPSLLFSIFIIVCLCLGAQSFEHANVLSEKINFSALGGPKVAIFGRDDLDPIYFDVIN